MSLANTLSSMTGAEAASHRQTDQLDIPLISKDLIRQRFDRASQSYQTHNGVQKRIARALLERMAAHTTTDAVLLDLGCGPGPDWHELTQHCQQYIGIDLSAAMLAAHVSQQTPTTDRDAWLLQADMESLPLPTASVDTLYSSMAMQWTGSRQRLCKELKRVLKPGADAFVSVPLKGSLEPLAEIRRGIDAQPQVNPQPGLQQWVDDFKLTGWTIQALEQRSFTQYFTDLRSLLHSIKGVGAGANQALPLNRRSLSKLADEYENRRSKHGLPLQYKVALFHLKRP